MTGVNDHAIITSLPPLDKLIQSFFLYAVNVIITLVKTS